MSQLCTTCGAPRTTTAPACPFCHTLFAGETPPTGDVEILAILDRDGLPAATKRYRELNNTGLKDAMHAVQALDAQRKR
jgi:hypothetical protein